MNRPLIILLINRFIHTPQSFKLNGKLGDILKFSDYRELVQQVKRFKTRPGNAEVEIYLYRDEYMNDALRSWTLTRLHLYYGSERARASGEDHQFTSAELTNMESLEFLVVLERVFISTNCEPTFTYKFILTKCRTTRKIIVSY